MAILQVVKKSKETAHEKDLLQMVLEGAKNSACKFTKRTETKIYSKVNCTKSWPMFECIIVYKIDLVTIWDLLTPLAFEG